MHVLANDSDCYDNDEHRDESEQTIDDMKNLSMKRSHGRHGIKSTSKTLKKGDIVGA